MVAFDETVYEVSEGTPHVQVCVNLTKPEHDIQDELVFVEVLDDFSSVYIPVDATHASKSHMVCNLLRNIAWSHHSHTLELV